MHNKESKITKNSPKSEVKMSMPFNEINLLPKAYAKNLMNKQSTNEQ